MRITRCLLPVLALFANGCVLWQQEPVPTPGTNVSLGRVVVGTATGESHLLSGAYVARDTLYGDEQVHDERLRQTGPLVRVSLPLNAVVSIKQGQVNSALTAGAILGSVAAIVVPTIIWAARAAQFQRAHGL
jgi:hypothetical protein